MSAKAHPSALGRAKAAALLLAVSVLEHVRGDEQRCHRVTAATCIGPKNVKEYLAQVINNPNYDKEVPPNEACGSDEPVKVEFQFYLTYIGSINQMLGQVTLGGYFRQYWKDPRLAFDSTGDGCPKTLTMPVQFRPTDHIWTPNLYVDNGVTWRRGASFTSVGPDGKVFVSEEASITLKLNMRFDRMPFDKHKVFMELASYSMDSNTVRLMAKDGKAGAGTSGIGITTTKIEHPVWLIEDGESAKSGFSTPGVVVVKDFGSDWDYLTVYFDLARRPKYLIDNVLLQDLMFLGVSYVGFFVNPTTAPARAAMAVIPVLIMRTLANSVFSGLPQLSYPVWVADSLQVSTFLCVLCVVQFGITQYCLLNEARATRRFNKLQECEKDMKAIVAEARSKNKTTLEYVESLKTTDVDQDQVRSWNYKGESGEATADGAAITEARLGVLEHAIRQFKKFDKDQSGHLNCREIQKMLTSFNVFMLPEDVGVAMCKFMRDSGTLSPKDPMKAQMKLGHFLEFLFDIDDYLIAVPPHFQHPFSRTIPPSRRWDIGAQWLFPVIVGLKVGIFYAALGTYESLVS